MIPPLGFVAREAEKRYNSFTGEKRKEGDA